MNLMLSLRSTLTNKRIRENAELFRAEKSKFKNINHHSIKYN